MRPDPDLDILEALHRTDPEVLRWFERREAFMEEELVRVEARYRRYAEWRSWTQGLGAALVLCWGIPALAHLTAFSVGVMVWPVQRDFVWMYLCGVVAGTGVAWGTLAFHCRFEVTPTEALLLAASQGDLSALAGPRLQGGRVGRGST